MSMTIFAFVCTLSVVVMGLCQSGSFLRMSPTMSRILTGRVQFPRLQYVIHPTRPRWEHSSGPVLPSYGNGTSSSRTQRNTSVILNTGSLTTITSEVSVVPWLLHTHSSSSSAVAGCVRAVFGSSTRWSSSTSFEDHLSFSTSRASMLKSFARSSRFLHDLAWFLCEFWPTGSPTSSSESHLTSSSTTLHLNHIQFIGCSFFDVGNSLSVFVMTIL